MSVLNEEFCCSFINHSLASLSTISSLFVRQFCPSQGFGQRPPVDDRHAGITAARCVVAVFHRWSTHTDCLLQRNVPRPSWLGINITETRFANFNSMLYNTIRCILRRIHKIVNISSFELFTDSIYIVRSFDHLFSFLLYILLLLPFLLCCL